MIEPIPTGYAVGACFPCGQVVVISLENADCLLCGKPLTALLLGAELVPAPASEPPVPPAVVEVTIVPAETLLQCPHCTGNLFVDVSGSAVSLRAAHRGVDAGDADVPGAEDVEPAGGAEAAAAESEPGADAEASVNEQVAAVLFKLGSGQIIRNQSHSALTQLGLTDAEAREAIDAIVGKVAGPAVAAAEETAAAEVDAEPPVAEDGGPA